MSFVFILFTGKHFTRDTESVMSFVFIILILTCMHFTESNISFEFIILLTGMYFIREYDISFVFII